MACRVDAAPGSLNGTTAWSYGAESAARAITTAQQNGLLSGATIALDIEHWQENDLNCGWWAYLYAANFTNQLHYNGYKVVIYGDDINMKTIMDFDASTRLYYPGMRRFDGIIMTGIPGQNSIVDDLPNSWDGFYIDKRATQYDVGPGGLGLTQTWGAFTFKLDKTCALLPANKRPSRVFLFKL